MCSETAPAGAEWGCFESGCWRQPLDARRRKAGLARPHRQGHGIPFLPCKRKKRRVSPAVARRASHRSVRAQLRHTARQATGSPYRFASRGHSVNQGAEVQCPRLVSCPQDCSSALPSLHRVLAVRVPRLRRYYEVLRFPAALPVTLRFLRLTVTIPLRLSSFIPPSPRPTWGRGALGLALPLEAS
jgi:hypothetical protein